MGDSKTFGIPEAKGLTRLGIFHLILKCVYTCKRLSLINGMMQTDCLYFVRKIIQNTSIRIQK